MIKQVLVVRKDLNMRKGKIAGQCAHASLAIFLNKSISGLDGLCITIPLSDEELTWITTKFTKIVLGVESEAELLAIDHAAQQAGLRTALIKDAGDTVFHGVPTYTVLAIGPDDDQKIDKITGHLKLL